MKELRNLVLSFTDEGGNKKNITIPTPKDSVNRTDAEAVANIITTKKLINGKEGTLHTFNGAFMVVRTERVL